MPVHDERMNLGTGPASKGRVLAGPGPYINKKYIYIMMVKKSWIQLITDYLLQSCCCHIINVFKYLIEVNRDLIEVNRYLIEVDRNLTKTY